MTRSIYKADFISNDIRRKIADKTQEDFTALQIQTRNRNTTITEQMMGAQLQVYTGKIYSKLVIKNAAMIGHKLGEFIFTKRMGSYLHKKSAEERSRKKKAKLLAQKQARKKNKSKPKGKKNKKK